MFSLSTRSVQCSGVTPPCVALWGSEPDDPLYQGIPVANRLPRPAAGRDLIQSIDVNPFICLPQGGKAVDAVIVTRAMQ